MFVVKVPKQKFSLKNKSRIEKRKGIDQANLVFAYHVPIMRDKKNYAAQVLSTLIAEGFSSRLVNEIREKRNLAYAIKGEFNISKDYAYNLIYVGTTKENVQKVKELILKEFGKVGRDLTEKELNEVKNQLVSNYQISMEDSQTQVINLLYAEVHGDANEFYEYEKHILGVKLGDVREIAKKAANKYSFFVLEPEE